MERRVSGKLSCTVWIGGKDGDSIKVLPIDIKVVFEGNTLTVEKNPLEHADHTYTLNVNMMVGVDVIVGSKFGAIILP